MTIYHIRVQSHLPDRYLIWFDGLTITREPAGQTLLSGELTDQAALFGVLRKIIDLGLPLLEVTSAPLRTGQLPVNEFIIFHPHSQGAFFEQSNAIVTQSRMETVCLYDGFPRYNSDSYRFIHYGNVGVQDSAFDSATVAQQETHRRLLAEREEERKRVARELHDQTIQDLLGVNCRLEAIEEEKVTDSSVQDELHHLRGNVRQVIEDLRNICGELRPPTIDSLGLGIAVNSFSQEWSEQTSIEVNLDIDANLKRLPEAVELSVFRIVQEGLRNVNKHAQAAAVEIRLIRTADLSLLIAISDDGLGLPADFDLSQMAAEGHYGLLGISERVALLDGQLSLENKNGSGLLLQVEIPHFCCVTS